jgi:hypothetical protein
MNEEQRSCDDWIINTSKVLQAIDVFIVRRKAIGQYIRILYNCEYGQPVVDTNVFFG